MSATTDPRYFKVYRVEQARGLRRTVPAEKTRAHVQFLLDRGASQRAVAEAAGIDPIVVTRLLNGQATVRTSTARAVAAVQLVHVLNRAKPRGSVPAAGTIRRIQALLVMGWRHQDIRSRTGVATHVLLAQRAKWVARQTHERIAEAFEEWWNQPGPSLRTANTARRAGYLPPLAWDDDTIDDPTYVPNVGKDAKQRRAEVIEEIEFLLQTGCGQTEVVHRAGYNSFQSLERHCLRYGRPDIPRRLRQPNMQESAA